MDAEERPLSPAVVCVLRSGGVYGPEHVDWLRRQVRAWTPDVPFIVMTDLSKSTFAFMGIEVVPLVDEWTGWWAKMELFRPSLFRDRTILYLDLDVVVCGHIGPLLRVPERTTLLRGFYTPAGINSSVMYLTAEDRLTVWYNWTTDPGHWMEWAGRGGDQVVIGDILGRTAARWQDVAPGTILSYKADIRSRYLRPPAGTRLVVFHGNPRPWNIAKTNTWIPPLGPVDLTKGIDVC